VDVLAVRECEESVGGSEYGVLRSKCEVELVGVKEKRRERREKREKRVQEIRMMRIVILLLRCCYSKASCDWMDEISEVNER